MPTCTYDHQRVILNSQHYIRCILSCLFVDVVELLLSKSDIDLNISVDSWMMDDGASCTHVQHDDSFVKIDITNMY